MDLRAISVKNYRSLQDVSLRPGRLSLLIGANASGKSNFVDCLAFLSDIYRDGLEFAIQRAGGILGLGFRKRGRQTLRERAPVQIELEVEVDPISTPFAFAPNIKGPRLRFVHRFSVGSRIIMSGGDYSVFDESMRISGSIGRKWKEIMSIVRDQDGTPSVQVADDLKFIFGQQPQTLNDNDAAIYYYFFGLDQFNQVPKNLRRVSEFDLMTRFIAPYFPAVNSFRRAMAAIRVHQFNMASVRSVAVPSPNAEIERFGRNLPAAVYYLERDNKDAWQEILALMKRVLPNLRSINSYTTPDGTVALRFFEHGFIRPWTVKEVSDGTMQMLATLVAIFDPRATFDIIEEPENSVHPWLLRVLLDACRKAAMDKQILITSHSPVLIEQFSPKDTFVVWRSEGASRIDSLAKLDSYLDGKLKTGKARLYEYLDSGIIPEAVPPAPEISATSN